MNQRGFLCSVGLTVLVCGLLWAGCSGVRDDVEPPRIMVNAMGRDECLATFRTWITYEHRVFGPMRFCTAQSVAEHLAPR